MLRKKVLAIFLLVCLSGLHRLHAQADELYNNEVITDTVVNDEDYDDEDYYEPDTTNQIVNTDRAAYFNDSINVRHFDKQEWEKLTKGVNYEEEEKKEQEKGKGDKKDTSKSFKLPIINSLLAKTILLLIAAFIIGLVAFAIFKDIRRSRNLDNKLAGPELTLNEDELPEKDVLRKLLAEAIANGNYKLATRYYYLLMILQYKQQGLIKWKKDKTNNQYLRELRNNPKYADIKAGTHLFERFWYGDIEPDGAMFVQVETIFNRILNNYGK